MRGADIKGNINLDPARWPAGSDPPDSVPDEGDPDAPTVTPADTRAARPEPRRRARRLQHAAASRGAADGGRDDAAPGERVQGAFRLEQSHPLDRRREGVRGRGGGAARA